MITVRQAVRQGASRLQEAGVENAEYDSFMMLSKITGMDRASYYAYPDKTLSEEEYAEFCGYIRRRASREPLQHILGEAWFFGFKFEVNRNVLIPRQDTEVLVEQALAKINDGSSVLDMCTGSGCILLSIACKRRLSRGVGVDISAEALETAAKNSVRLGAENVEFMQGDLFEGLEGRMQAEKKEKELFDVIVSNPPYIESSAIAGLQPEVRLHDPLAALDGGPDGLHFYRAITEQSVRFLKKGGWLMFEIGCSQAEAVCGIMSAHNFTKLTVARDLAGLNRVVFGRLL